MSLQLSPVTVRTMPDISKLYELRSKIGTYHRDDVTGFDYAINPNHHYGIQIDITGHKLSMDNYAQQLHKNDRAHMDTPGSMFGCGCKSCNSSRGTYGKSQYAWGIDRVREHGTIDGYTVSDIEYDILTRLLDKYGIK